VNEGTARELVYSGGRSNGSHWQNRCMADILTEEKEKEFFKRTAVPSVTTRHGTKPRAVD
jgi:hypothetical protein